MSHFGLVWAVVFVAEAAEDLEGSSSSAIDTNSPGSSVPVGSDWDFCSAGDEVTMRSGTGCVDEGDDNSVGGGKRWDVDGYAGVGVTSWSSMTTDDDDVAVDGLG